MNKVKQILIIIQRSNGDVLLSQSLISNLFKYYNFPKIDLLVNDDTVALAKILSNVNHIHAFSYKQKKENRWKQEKSIIKKIFRKYDLSINLTSSDRSVMYALFASKTSISAVENSLKKSWWKKLLLDYFYKFDSNRHTLLNNLEPLNLLNIDYLAIQESPALSKSSITNIKHFLNEKNISRFLIFHPSAQYQYKIYPLSYRNKLLTNLSDLGVSILITGGKTKIDYEIKNSLPSLPNVYDLIGETSLDEYFALSSLCDAYIGMDTLNMHIAAAQNKRIFAIFGPTKLSMWSPWSNQIKKSTIIDLPYQNYCNVSIFQANFPCVACGNAGCDDKHGRSICLDNINPNFIFSKIEEWHMDKSSKLI